MPKLEEAARRAARESLAVKGVPAHRDIPGLHFGSREETPVACWSSHAPALTLCSRPS